MVYMLHRFILIYCQVIYHSSTSPNMFLNLSEHRSCFPSGLLDFIACYITMSETVPEFVSSLLNLVEEITCLTPNHVEQHCLEMNSSRLAEAKNQLCWMQSVLSEKVVGAECRSFSDQLVQIEESLESLQLHLCDKIGSLDSTRFCYPTEQGNTGQPRFIITHKQISYLKEFPFKWMEIADLLRVLISTLNHHRSLLGFGSDAAPRLTGISDSDLDVLLRDIVRQLHFIQGEMESRGTGVQRERERGRASLHQVESLNIRGRLRHMFERQQYSVKVQTHSGTLSCL